MDGGLEAWLERPGGRFRDRFDRKVSDWIRPWARGATGALPGGEGDAGALPVSAAGALPVSAAGGEAADALPGDAGAFDAALIGAPLSKTSISHSAAFRLPDAIRAAFAGMTPYSVTHGVDVGEVIRVIDLGNIRMHPTDLAACHSAIEAAVRAYWRRFDRPLVLLGGDHSVTGAAILGMAAARGRRYGILHFDAHHDVRNLEDGGRTNGTPMRTVLDSGVVDGRNVVQIGLRDFANSAHYHRYALEHGVTVVPMRAVRRRGLAAVVDEAVGRLAASVDAVYVTFDMDALDPAFAPGVAAPVPYGLTLWEAADALEALGGHPKVCGLDVVCADPSQDVRDLTVRAAAHLVLSFWTGMALRKLGRG
ncbi:agmatinase family protein [Alicyclobacillus sp.]|uniref:agmatinase family protein n=1 Tax=Alicyclobacillus sp. TaxID=61169 RepID=UPI0025C72517|nr:agmatinase family protein [Alicyclobacillus sp.]